MGTKGFLPWIFIMDMNGIVLFGEAEKGEFGKGYCCFKLEELADIFGNPPDESLGLFYATQSLLYHHPLVYFRVPEEGFSKDHYVDGIQILGGSPWLEWIKAVCTPGLGDRATINSFLTFCTAHHQFLITNERDFFDYLMTNL